MPNNRPPDAKREIFKMGETNTNENGNAPDSGDVNTENQDTGNAPDSGKINMIPKARLDAEIAKRKAAEESLTGIADELIADIPEDMRDVVPNLPPADKIKWIRNAKSKGLFQAEKRESNSPDSKRPGSKSGTESVSAYEQYYESKNN